MTFRSCCPTRRQLAGRDGQSLLARLTSLSRSAATELSISSGGDTDRSCEGTSGGEWGVGGGDGEPSLRWVEGGRLGIDNIDGIRVNRDHGGT